MFFLFLMWFYYDFHLKIIKSQKDMDMNTIMVLALFSSYDFFAYSYIESSFKQSPAKQCK